MGCQREIAGRLSAVNVADGGKPVVGTKPRRRLSGPAKGCDGFRAASAPAGEADRHIAIHPAADRHHREKICASLRQYSRDVNVG